MIATLVKPVPVVPRHPYHVTDLQLHLPVVCWFVTQYCLLLVFILASVIPNVVQRLEPRAGVSVMLLHDLVSNPADLTTEGADQVVGEREQVDILDDSPQGAVRVPGADSGCPGHLLVSEKLDIWIFLATLAQHSGLGRGNINFG